MKKKLKKMAISLIAATGMTLAFFSVGASLTCAYGTGGDGVAISRVTANTRHAIQELSNSPEAERLAHLLQQLSTQYEAWSQDCGGQHFSPQDASPTCRAKMSQMAGVQGKIYKEGAKYLLNIAPRYAQGKREAAAISDSLYSGQSLGDIYGMILNGADGSVSYEYSNDGTGTMDDSPFPIDIDTFNDPGAAMLTSLQQLVPELSDEIPELVRAGVLAGSLAAKEKMARSLAQAFTRAGNILESQRDYETISLSITEQVKQVPRLLGITGVGAGGFTARADKYVLAWQKKKSEIDNTSKKIGGFQPRK